MMHWYGVGVQEYRHAWCRRRHCDLHDRPHEHRYRGVCTRKGTCAESQLQEKIKYNRSFDRVLTHRPSSVLLDR